MRVSTGACVWAVLLALTATNWLLMEFGSWHLAIGRQEVGTIIVAVALVKVRLIMRYFMEVRDAPIALGLIMDGWLAAVFVSLSIWPYLTATP